MVAINAYTWKEFVTGTGTEYIYGTQLNANFDYISAMVNKGVAGVNIATGGIDSPTLFAGSVITEGSIDYGTGDGVGVVQIGKDRTTTGGQMLVKGTSLITAANTTNTNITVYFTNGDVCTAGDPAYTAAPHLLNGYCVTADGNVYYAVLAEATDSMQINVAPAAGTLTFTQNWTYKWAVIGNV